MKTIKFLAVITVLTLTAASCVEKSGKYQTLLAERDSLKTEATSLETDYNETLKILNDVENGFAVIRESENKMRVELPGIEGQNATKRQQIASQLTQIKEILDQNRSRIEELQRISGQKGKQNSTLAATIKRMETELNERTSLIASLQDELVHKNVRIEELTTTVTDLNHGLANLNEVSQQQQTTIRNQDKNINTVWYCVATSQELKEAQILSGNGLFRPSTVLDKTFDQTAFKEADLRNVFAVSTDSKRVKMLSTHPKDSYTLAKGDDKMITIEITDPEKFWSVSKYLVVQK